MLDGEGDGKRSRARPFFGFVVSQKKRNVRLWTSAMNGSSMSWSGRERRGSALDTARKGSVLVASRPSPPSSTVRRLAWPWFAGNLRTLSGVILPGKLCALPLFFPPGLLRAPEKFQGAKRRRHASRDLWLMLTRTLRRSAASNARRLIAD
jgi:hypothetical protein